MNTQLIIKNTDNTRYTEENILSFTFTKEAYTPYTSLSAKLLASAETFTNASEILLYVGNKLVHHGLADSIVSTYSESADTVSISSRGFTSLLVQNQTEPGLKTNMTINRLMDSFYTFPYVTHENSSETSYIFVKNNSTMWEGIVNLAYKLYGTYPYIRDTNHIRVTCEEYPLHFRYDSSSLLSTGNSLKCRNLYSNFHMSDINEEFGQYELADSDVIQRNIVRHKFFELDMQFLYDPQQALVYMDKWCSRGEKRIFCTYSGYNGEDLYDTVSFGSISAERIAKIKISGDSSGVVTEISVYRDGFFPVV